MRYTAIGEEILLPRAITALDDRLRQQVKIDENVITEIAGELYRRHRGESRGKVKERSFDELPVAQKGKYCAIVKMAIAQLKAGKIHSGRL